MNILSTENLTKRFGEMAAVNGVSLVFREKELAAIIGPNGAGKSTFFNLLSGRLKPSDGKIFCLGQQITGWPPFKIQRLGVGRSFQVTNIFKNFTVFENVQLGILAHHDKCRNIGRPVEHAGEGAKVMDILEAVGLAEERNTIAGVMSHGDQKCLEIALSLTNDPKLLLLDEPTAGMNPEETNRIACLVQRIAMERQNTVIFCEHDMKLVFGLAQRIVVMQQGQVIADGGPEEIRCNAQVRTAYLGTEEAVC
jgi:branched-chain amino acid transport system ATP-binding protein